MVIVFEQSGGTQWKYVGLQQKDKTNEPADNWYWIDGKGNLIWPVDQTLPLPWRPGEPNDWNDGEECCAVKQNDAQINDCRCNRNINFICQYRKWKVSVHSKSTRTQTNVHP